MRPGFFWCKGNRAGVWHGMWMRSLNGESDGKGKMKEKLRLAVFGHKRWSREGGVEIVAKELCTRMAQQGCQVTCYNRSGHHVSGAEYDDASKIEYAGICQKYVPTIQRRGDGDIIWTTREKPDFMRIYAARRFHLNLFLPVMVRYGQRVFRG